MVARTAGGREVAGSNPVTPIPWQGHARRSDPSGGLRKRETVLRFLFFPLRNISPKRELFWKKKGIEKPGKINVMILPGFVTAETAGFEPIELKKKM